MLMLVVLSARAWTVGLPASLERASFEARRSLPWEIFVRDPNREVVFSSVQRIKNHDVALWSLKQ